MICNKHFFVSSLQSDFPAHHIISQPIISFIIIQGHKRSSLTLIKIKHLSQQWFYSSKYWYTQINCLRQNQQSKAREYVLRALSNIIGCSKLRIWHLFKLKPNIFIEMNEVKKDHFSAWRFLHRSVNTDIWLNRLIVYVTIFFILVFNYYNSIRRIHWEFCLCLCVTKAEAMHLRSSHSNLGMVLIGQFDCDIH